MLCDMFIHGINNMINGRLTSDGFVNRPNFFCVCMGHDTVSLNESIHLAYTIYLEVLLLLYQSLYLKAKYKHFKLRKCFEKSFNFCNRLLLCNMIFFQDML